MIQHASGNSLYRKIMSRKIFIDALAGKTLPGRVAAGTGTSVVCKELMDSVNSYFPEGHTDPEAMFSLALAGSTLLGFDSVMPLFGTCHEASAMGCDVDWGGPDMMPESGKPIFGVADDIKIPADLLSRPGCAVPIKAISMLKRELGGAAAVCGKVFGSWTQAYHYFGIENFLIKTITEPGEVKRIMENLLPVTLQFAEAQVDAGADCLLLADHATMDLCSPEAYREFLAGMHSYLAGEIAVPVILHICGNSSDRIGYIAETGIDCFHWDTKTGPPEEVRKLAGGRLSLMGGISNLTLLSGSPGDIFSLAAAAAEAGIDVVGPECAVPLSTPLENLKAAASIKKKQC